jgi:phosphoglycerol transferase MdoB-like AlkP superfamily enzyme
MTFKGRVGGLYLLFLVFLAFSFITRTVLLVRALPNLDIAPFLLAKIYGVGLFFDCVTFSFIAIPVYLYALLVPDKVFRWRWVARVAFFIVSFLLMFNLVSEYVFFDEFGTRYNFIAIDYLIYTTEVIRNIVESYPIARILGIILILSLIICFGLRKFVDQACETTTTLKQRLKRGWMVALLPVVAWFCVDLSWTSISANNYAVELAGNGLYNLAAAFRANELDYDKFYATRDTGLVLTRLKEMLKDDDEVFSTRDIRDISRVVRPEGPEQKLNIIVIVEESLSAEFLGTFGNRLGLTPNLDRLAKESLLFTNLFATGTRTVRGLEAITLSMPPLPGCSVVKRPDNERLFSWGEVMKAKGYENRFIYGGNGYFDNMNYFYSHNGFAIVDKHDFSPKEITFDNAWGVCDEDLFMKVISEADRSSSSGKPFFSIVMTTSNHRPFTYPKGKIYVPSGAGREGGVMYADYAIGRMMAEARKRDWFDKTVFVIVADHCASSARKYALPVKDYRIPLIVYSPSHVAPRRVDSIASQIDVAPTVLGLLNFNYTSRFIGRDILDEDAGHPRAFISTYEKLGYIEDGRLLVLSPKRGVACYRFDIRSGETREMPRQESLLRDAVGFYQGTNYLYKNRLDRFDAAPALAGPTAVPRYAKRPAGIRAGS